jgi:hypothetical protein
VCFSSGDCAQPLIDAYQVRVLDRVRPKRNNASGWRAWPAKELPLPIRPYRLLEKAIVTQPIALGAILTEVMTS